MVLDHTTNEDPSGDGLKGLARKDLTGFENLSGLGRGCIKSPSFGDAVLGGVTQEISLPVVWMRTEFHRLPRMASRLRVVDDMSR